eukprot:INCI13415.6.p1 GENE.INCI13415.6~~INCI13415.6.p1  ORF type:complete len:2381 (+),score=532.45 INCI13415.6:269-7411(+)
MSSRRSARSLGKQRVNYKEVDEYDFEDEQEEDDDEEQDEAGLDSGVASSSKRSRARSGGKSSYGDADADGDDYQDDDDSDEAASVPSRPRRTLRSRTRSPISYKEVDVDDPFSDDEGEEEEDDDQQDEEEDDDDDESNQKPRFIADNEEEETSSAAGRSAPRPPKPLKLKFTKSNKNIKGKTTARNKKEKPSRRMPADREGKIPLKERVEALIPDPAHPIVPHIEKILAVRGSSVADPSTHELLVKWRHRAYVHASWIPRLDAEAEFERSHTRVKMFIKRRVKQGLPPLMDDEEIDEAFDPIYTTPEKVIAHQDIVFEAEAVSPQPISPALELDQRNESPVAAGDADNATSADSAPTVNIEPTSPGPTTSPSNSCSKTAERIRRFYLVKWTSLQHNECTWELEDAVAGSDVIEAYNRRTQTLSKLGNRTQRDPLWMPVRADLEGLRFGANRDLKLRPYQTEGVKWLCFNWNSRRSSILADEMGLGKTIQTIALLRTINLARTESLGGPCLVVAPLSCLKQWFREIELWWPEANTVLFHGNDETRYIIDKYEWFADPSDSSSGGGGTGKSTQYRFTVCVTTYEMAANHASILRKVPWQCVVVDEAHRLKNRNSKLAVELFSFQREYCLLLTGTPLQNNTEELWSLFRFIDPENFRDPTEFLSRFGVVDSAQKVQELHTMLKPYLLRRTKDVVEKDIPAKEETIIEVPLMPMQKQFYKAILERNTSFLFQGAKAGPSLMNIAMELRKCCNHPYLIKGAEAILTRGAPSLSVDGGEALTARMVEVSGKFVLLDKLLPRLRSTGHKVLIFSQMVMMLDILHDYCNIRGFNVERLDGRCRGTDRQRSIDRYMHNEDSFIMLLSTRAGGVGINLTAADTVIIYDSDWNPQNDLQAQARAHRIGQTRHVNVYRLLTRKSFEMEMFHQASLKLGLDKAVLSVDKAQQNSDTSTGKKRKLGGSKTKGGIDIDEVDGLLKRGAYDVFNEQDDAESQEFFGDDIDRILARNTKKIVHDKQGKDDKVMNNAFSKASFVSGADEVDIDDPDFWTKAVGFEQPVDIDDLIDDNDDEGLLGRRGSRKRRKVRRMGMVDTVGGGMSSVFEDTESDEDDEDGDAAENGNDESGDVAASNDVDDWEGFANFYAGIGLAGQVLDFPSARTLQDRATTSTLQALESNTKAATTTVQTASDIGAASAEQSTQGSTVGMAGSPGAEDLRSLSALVLDVEYGMARLGWGRWTELSELVSCERKRSNISPAMAERCGIALVHSYRATLQAHGRQRNWQDEKAHRRRGKQKKKKKNSRAQKPPLPTSPFLSTFDSYKQQYGTAECLESDESLAATDFGSLLGGVAVPETTNDAETEAFDSTFNNANPAVYSRHPQWAGQMLLRLEVLMRLNNQVRAASQKILNELAAQSTERTVQATEIQTAAAASSFEAKAKAAASWPAFIDPSHLVQLGVVVGATEKDRGLIKKLCLGLVVALKGRRKPKTAPSLWWGVPHDGALLLGFFLHGFGQFAKIFHDERLGLADRYVETQRAASAFSTSSTIDRSTTKATEKNVAVTNAATPGVPSSTFELKAATELRGQSQAMEPTEGNVVQPPSENTQTSAEQPASNEVECAPLRANALMDGGSTGADLPMWPTDAQLVKYFFWLLGESRRTLRRFRMRRKAKVHVDLDEYSDDSDDDADDDEDDDDDDDADGTSPSSRRTPFKSPLKRALAAAGIAKRELWRFLLAIAEFGEPVDEPSEGSNQNTDSDVKQSSQPSAAATSVASAGAHIVQTNGTNSSTTESGGDAQKGTGGAADDDEEDEDDDDPFALWTWAQLKIRADVDSLSAADLCRLWFDKVKPMCEQLEAELLAQNLPPLTLVVGHPRKRDSMKAATPAAQSDAATAKATSNELNGVNPESVDATETNPHDHDRDKEARARMGDVALILPVDEKDYYSNKSRLYATNLLKAVRMISELRKIGDTANAQHFCGAAPTFLSDCWARAKAGGAENLLAAMFRREIPVWWTPEIHDFELLRCASTRCGGGLLSTWDAKTVQGLGAAQALYFQQQNQSPNEKQGSTQLDEPFTSPFEKSRVRAFIVHNFLGRPGSCNMLRAVFNGDAEARAAWVESAAAEFPIAKVLNRRIEALCILFSHFGPKPAVDGSKSSSNIELAPLPLTVLCDIVAQRMTRVSARVSNTKAVGPASRTWRRQLTVVRRKINAIVKRTLSGVVDRVCRDEKQEEAMDASTTLRIIREVVHTLTKDVIVRHRDEQKRETKNAKIRGTVRRCVDDILRKVVKRVQTDERAAFRQKQLEDRQRRKEEDAQRKRLRQEALRETRKRKMLDMLGIKKEREKRRALRADERKRKIPAKNGTNGKNGKNGKKVTASLARMIEEGFLEAGDKNLVIR